MTRFFCLALMSTLASVSASNAQGKKDPPKKLTNSLGMKFVWIPPGSFMMGSPKGEKERQADETQHKVTLTKGFYMGAFLVTQEQWKEVRSVGNEPDVFFRKGEKNLPKGGVCWVESEELHQEVDGKGQKAVSTPNRG